MPNYTIEDYKEAIRAKYEKDVNNPLSDAPTSLGQAYLRDFCWQKFEGEMSSDDLRTFTSFFGFEFNPERRNHFRESTNKFKPIGTFLSRKTDLATRDAINLTAILIDFQHRPFRKFQEKGIITYLQHSEDSKTAETFVTQHEDEVKEEDKDKEINPVETSSIDNVEVTKEEDFVDTKTNSSNEEENKDFGKIGIITLFSGPRIRSIKEIILYYLYKLKNAAIAMLLIFALISTVIYFAFFKNDCMQWSGDHYEVVDCSSKNEETVVIPKNDELLDFRKLKICDTTHCFRKDGEAFVWYTKTPNGGIDFFNSHGRHPEYNRPLRPVSHYIFDKYVKGKPCK